MKDTRLTWASNELVFKYNKLRDLIPENIVRRNQKENKQGQKIIIIRHFSDNLTWHLSEGIPQIILGFLSWHSAKYYYMYFSANLFSSVILLRNSLRIPPRFAFRIWIEILLPRFDDSFRNFYKDSSLPKFILPGFSSKINLVICLTPPLFD